MIHGNKSGSTDMESFQEKKKKQDALEGRRISIFCKEGRETSQKAKLCMYMKFPEGRAACAALEEVTDNAMPC